MFASVDGTLFFNSCVLAQNGGGGGGEGVTSHGEINQLCYFSRLNNFRGEQTKQFFVLGVFLVFFVLHVC